MKQQVILFDLDGTLIDPMMGITKSVQYALKQFDITISDLNDLKPFIGPPLRESFAKLYGFDEAQCKEAIEQYRVYYRAGGIFDNEVYEGMVTCLEALKAYGKRLALATSKPEEFARQIMEHYDLAKYFDFIGGSEFHAREAKHEVIEYVLKQMQVNRDDCVMVGDRRHDVVGAHLSSIPCVGVLYGYGSLAELQEAKADIIVKDIQELTSCLCE